MYILIALFAITESAQTERINTYIIFGMLLLVVIGGIFWVRSSKKDQLRKQEKKAIKKQKREERRAAMTPEERNAEGIRKAHNDAEQIAHLGIEAAFSEIVTVGSVVVTYRPGLLTDRDTAKQKLIEILEGNPNVDLRKIQGALGIVIIDVAGQRERPSVLKADVEMGDVE